MRPVVRLVFGKRLADTVSTLGGHLKRGYAEEYFCVSRARTIALESAFHSLGVSARHFHIAFQSLRSAARTSGTITTHCK
jgi:hypothetical protein